MSIEEFNALKEELLFEGWIRYMNPIDWDVATDSPCPVCGGKTTGEGLKQPGRHGAYRCWSICENCDTAEEF